MRWVIAYLVVGAAFGLRVADHRAPHSYFGNAFAGMLIGVPMLLAETGDLPARDVAARLDALEASKK